MAYHCEICDYEFKDDVTFNTHLKTDDHICKEGDLRDLRTVYITDELNDCFKSAREFLTQFGCILVFRRSHKRRDLWRVVFEKKESVDALLNDPLIFNGKKLMVNRKERHQESPDAPQTEPRADFQNVQLVESTENRYEQLRAQAKVNEDIANQMRMDKLKAMLSKNDSFDNQLNKFLGAIQISKEDLIKYDRVVDTLTRVFKRSFPRCKVKKFGSTYTNLGFKNCDLDVYVDIGEALEEDNDETVNSNVWTPSKVFKEAKRLINKERQLFKNTRSVPHAKVPIIQLQHRNVSCDVSFDGQGSHNTNLVKFYLVADRRLEPLMMVIKFWAQTHGLTGARAQKLPNYGLILLIIFYLEQKEIIPTVHQLQSSVVPSEHKGWNVNFDRRQFKIKHRELDIPRLLYGFFDFYAKFDFASNIVCPLDGTPHSKTLFEDSQNIPETMTKYIEYLSRAGDVDLLKLYVEKPMCVQDPFRLNANITHEVNLSLCNIFQKHCALMANVFETAIRNKAYSRMLLDLITVNDDESIDKVQLTTETRGDKVSRRFKIQMPKVPFTCNSVFYKVVGFIEKFLLEAMMFKVELTLNDKKSQCQSVVFQCTGSHILWRNRDFESSSSNASLSQLDKEILISKKMFEKVKNCKPEAIVDFSCEIVRGLNSKICNVIIRLTNTGGSNEILEEFAQYLASEICDILVKTLYLTIRYNS